MKNVNKVKVLLHGGQSVRMRTAVSLSAAIFVWGTFYYLVSTNKLIEVLMDVQKKTYYCSREELKQGRWKEITLPEPYYIPPEGYYVGVHKGSVCRDFFPTNFNTYEWVPNNSKSNRYGRCVFHPWSADEFCSLGLSSIAFVGDSLSWEHYSSLVMSLGLHSNPNDMFVSRRGNKNFITLGGCNDTLRLIFRRSDQLEMVPQVIQEEKPQVLVLNKGSHAVSDEVYEAGWNSTMEALEEYERELVKTGLPNLFFFRTTVPGHPQCQNYDSPVNNITQMEEVIANKSSYPGKFRWWQFKAQNEIMEKLLASSSLRNFHIIDAYDINILRPDRHRPPDCLHNCFPGKTEVYNQIMLHYLKASALLLRPM